MAAINTSRRDTTIKKKTLKLMERLSRHRDRTEFETLVKNFAGAGSLLVVARVPVVNFRTVTAANTLITFIIDLKLFANITFTLLSTIP